MSTLGQPTTAPLGEDERKRLKKLERSLARAEERLLDYERLVDRTQHLLNTRIGEREEARRELSENQSRLSESEQRFRQLTEAAFEAILVHDAVIVKSSSGSEEPAADEAERLRKYLEEVDPEELGHYEM